MSECRERPGLAGLKRDLNPRGPLHLLHKGAERRFQTVWPKGRVPQVSYDLADAVVRPVCCRLQSGDVLLQHGAEKSKSIDGFNDLRVEERSDEGELISAFLRHPLGKVFDHLALVD